MRQHTSRQHHVGDRAGTAAGAVRAYLPRLVHAAYGARSGVAPRPQRPTAGAAQRPSSQRPPARLLVNDLDHTHTDQITTPGRALTGAAGVALCRAPWDLRNRTREP